MLPHNLAVGVSASLQATITEESLAAFAALSGDHAPLHTDEAFARSKGFEGRLVHGAYLVALVSRFVGMHFPGPNFVLLKCDLGFPNPCYAPAEVRIEGQVAQLSEATESIALSIRITDQRARLLARGTTTHKRLK